MLEAILQTDYTPGTNLPGEASGANWTFLLPGLLLGEVLCVGRPAETTLARLLRCGTRVHVLDGNGARDPQIVEAAVGNALCGVPAMSRDAERHRGRSLQETGRLSLYDATSDKSPDGNGGETLRFIAEQEPGSIPLSDRSVNTVLIAGRPGARRFRRDGRLRAELRRVLKEDGFVYVEHGGSRRTRSTTDAAGEFGTELRLSLTPLFGEPETAVPADDERSVRWLLDRRLDRPSITRQSLRSCRRSSRPGNGAAHEPKKRPRVTAVARTIGRGAIRLAGSLEHFVQKSVLTGRLVRRHGRLLGPGAGDLRGRPPEYVCAIARRAGIELAQYGWGMIAGGGFESRKVLFQLFDRETGAPRLVVKLPRNAAFNDRVESEYRALEWLQRHKVGDAETFPRPVFFGYENGLAVLGQTAVPGVPFEERTAGTADCPYARSVVERLTELGVATARWTSAETAGTGAALSELLDRFTQIYRPGSYSRDFLRDQIARIEALSDGCPCVFLHGDPHASNILVTGDGGVGFVDWEASEPQGLPLWDMLYFLRAWCMLAAGARNSPAQLEAFERHFMGASPLTGFVRDSIEAYCGRIAMNRELVEPLFYLCWMHRALREAIRLSPADLSRGHFFNLLNVCIERRAELVVNREW